MKIIVFLNETDKVDFPVGTPVVKYEDDGSGTLDNGQSGLTTLLIPKQMWAKTGLFAGYIGLKDENGSVFTSKDIFFKVLGNVLDAGVEINYFIGDFDKALAKAEKELEDKAANFDQTTAKALQDLKNKYDNEVASHEQALIDNNDQLKKLANAIGIINANLEANNVVTRPDFDKQNQRIDNTLSKMNLNVESYPELSDVKAKYPQGSSNLIVTNDGYRAVWDGKDWVKGSAFVAASFRNKAVAPTNVSNISYKQVLDNAIDFNSIKGWLQPGPSYVLKQDTSIDLEGTEGDNGLVIKVDASSLNDIFYINFKLKPLRNNNTDFFWLAAYPLGNGVRADRKPNFGYFPSAKYVDMWQYTDNLLGYKVDGSITVTTNAIKMFTPKTKLSEKVKKSKWKKTSGTFVLSQTLKLHKSPHIESPAIATLKKGSANNYDASLQGPLRLWLRQPRKNGYGYIVGKDKFGKKLGKFE